MTSDEGLDAYGAATWGQFFIYQGFNERVGWMHTSTGVGQCRRLRRNASCIKDGSCSTATARRCGR